MIVSQSFGKIKKERRAYLEQIGSGKYRGAIWKYGLSYCNDSLCGEKRRCGRCISGNIFGVGEMQETL